MLASVGAILVVEEINIAGLSLGRDKPGQRALTVSDVDSPLTGYSEESGEDRRRFRRESCPPLSAFRPEPFPD